jgi:hypothetical protein
MTFMLTGDQKELLESHASNKPCIQSDRLYNILLKRFKIELLPSQKGSGSNLYTGVPRGTFFNLQGSASVATQEVLPSTFTYKSEQALRVLVKSNVLCGE